EDGIRDWSVTGVQTCALPIYAAPGPAWHGQALLLRQLGDHGFGRDEQAGDRGRTLQRRAHHFSRVDDALRDEIAVLARPCVIARSEERRVGKEGRARCGTSE